MKKLSLVGLLIIASVASAGVFANPVSQAFGGFKGPSVPVSTVKSVLSGAFRDGQPVVLKGKIMASLGGDNYSFADATGSVPVEIDDDVWFGVQATPASQLTIAGKVDIKRRGISIEVDSVKLN